MFFGDGEVGFEDGFQESFSVLTKAAGAADVVAKARDNVVVDDGRRYVGAGIFRNEFFISSAAEVTLEKWGLPVAYFA
ncbi:hypothetical protein ACQ86N_07885 [Puia sp. P3]|uniref:hypothetical protein n=1 Tax=Puia sp. P3 TaxID=3423952 RepID=UPI003D675FE1